MFYKDENEESAKKREFALELLKANNDAPKAAFALGCHTGIALQIAMQWPNDPIVKAEIERVVGSSEAKKFLPTKEQQARDVYLIASDPRVSPDDRIKCHRLYAEIMQHIEKPKEGPTITVNQGVMVVPMAESEKEWERFATKQQRQLVEAGSVVVN